MIPSFLLKTQHIKNKPAKEIIFNVNDTVLTIGRDKSNTLVIYDDNRVSRSHARIEYSSTSCEYIDLGSSCGSKLNGQAVLRATLQSGDVIEIGQSVLIFRLKKKTRKIDKLLSWFK